MVTGRGAHPAGGWVVVCGGPLRGEGIDSSLPPVLPWVCRDPVLLGGRSWAVCLRCQA